MGFAGLFLGGAALLGVACSSDSDPNFTPGSEGGAAGEAGEAPAAGSAGSAGSDDTGAGGTVSGDQAGAPGAGSAGVPEAGASSTSAGAGGESEPGTAGAGPLACAPTGYTGPAAFPGKLTVPTDIEFKACRGGSARLFTAANNTDPTFTCCGKANEIDHSVELSGAKFGANGVLLALPVPEDVPSGEVRFDVTCSSGFAGTLKILVKEGAPPVVTGLAASAIFANDTLVVNGTDLGTVTSVSALSGNQAFTCAVDTQSATSISCHFADIPPGNYAIELHDDDCGSANERPALTIKPNP